MSRRIGILGGTFNPIHVGHLIMAETAREKFHLDKILFIPSATPPHKQQRDLPCPTLRLAIVQRAIAGNPFFEASDLEIHRGGKSYSYDTLRQLKEANPKDHYFFIIGSDSLAQIGSWHKVRDLMRLCQFIVVERPGEKKTTFALLKAMSAEDRHHFNCLVMDQFPVGVSSREIRNRVRKGLSVKYLLNEPAHTFVREAGLYKKKTKGGS